MITKLHNFLKIKLIKFFFYLDFNKKKVININHNGISLKFNVTNYLSYYRAKTFSNKEPETLDWIDSFNENSNFFDIGANVGTYSIYAAKSKNCKVYCFEPSVFNLELLVRNIQLNNINNSTYVIPIALSNKNSLESFNLSNLDNAGALSNFGHKFDQYGNEMNIKNYYNTLGMKLDYFVNQYGLKKPDYIKIDVDGIEHLILEGMDNILENVKSVLVELTSSFDEQTNLSHKILKSKNFVLDDKIINSDNSETQNQIWYKS